jgi:DNA repair exonuclease SbcCD nuclease subunit
MSKILVTADIHIHPHRKDTRRVEDGLRCLQWIYDTAREHAITTVVVVGDFMHDRFLLPAFAYSKACEIVAKEHAAGIKTIFVLGNHDMFFEDKWQVHALMPFKQWATVVDSPSTIEIEGHLVDILPYTPLPSHYLDSCFPKPQKVLLSHLSVADAILNAKFDVLSVEDDTKEKEVISPDAFKKWKKVWLGHYHYGQKLSKGVEYIGSPMQLTFGEAAQKKHIALFDLATLKTEYIENTVSPKFHIVEDVDDLDTLPCQDAYIEVRPKVKIENPFELQKKLMKLGARESEIIPVKVDVQAKTNKALSNITSFLHDKRKLIDGFVDGVKIPEGLDKALLKKIGHEIVAS